VPSGPEIRWSSSWTISSGGRRPSGRAWLRAGTPVDGAEELVRPSRLSDVAEQRAGVAAPREHGELVDGGDHEGGQFAVDLFVDEQDRKPAPRVLRPTRTAFGADAGDADLFAGLVLGRDMTRLSPLDRSDDSHHGHSVSGNGLGPRLFLYSVTLVATSAIVLAVALRPTHSPIGQALLRRARGEFLA
jgi:hypothetical protein